MNALCVGIAGIGAWSPEHGDWIGLRAWLRGEDSQAPASPRPPAIVLPQGERRRAPASVLLACEAAAQAVAGSGHDAAELPCVFASCHGEVAISDEMCATLARAPHELSPTRFHNSVHNAAVGYWTLATRCHRPSNAISAWHASFAAGLLEAAALAQADATPVLFASYDAAASGPLAQVLGADHSLASALVLVPAPTANGPRLRLWHSWNEAGPAQADAMTLLQALACGKPAQLALPAGAGRRLAVEMTP